jgi:hypothetical protein
MTVMDDFVPMSWDDARAYEREQAHVEDAEFTFEYEGQAGPAWDVWGLTWPQREADARQHLEHVDTYAGVYWYRDRRDDRVYGMPDITLVRAENDRVMHANWRGQVRRAAVKRVHYAVGMFVFLSLMLLGVVPDVIPWIWVALPVIVVAYRHALRRQPEPRYAKLTEARFDVFVSDEEIRDRRRRLIANLLTIGFAALLLWLFTRD